MSKRDECCLLGVLMPSMLSFGVAWRRSKISDFWPALGGARSPGIVSAAPGGGMCWNCKSAPPLLPWSHHIHTGALGLMTTLGARGCPNLEGVPGPDAPALPAAPGLVTPCCPPNCGAPPVEPDAPDWPGCSEPVPGAAPSAAG
jgi:hypothetical protein